MRWEGPRERLTRFDRVVEDVKTEAGDDTVILVEGRKDETALRRLGVESEVVRVSGNGRSLDETALRVATRYEDAILLTDWDGQGEALLREMKQLLEAHGVAPNTVHRQRLRNLTAKEIHDVESLASHRRSLEAEL